MCTAFRAENGVSNVYRGETVTFTAAEEMAEYYCQVHPNTMRGSIEVQS